MTNIKGLTLIETLLSITLLSFLTLSTGVSIRKSIKQKEKMQHQIDHSSQVQSALSLLHSDLSSTFRRDYPYINAIRQAENLRKQRLDTLFRASRSFKHPKSPNYEAPNFPKLNYYHKMEGSSDEIHFTIYQSQIYQQESAKMAPIQEVSYFLDSCKNSPQCLWRRISPVVDEELEEGGIATLLLENVKEFEIDYYDNDLEEPPQSRWDPEGRGRASNRQNPQEAAATWPKFITITLVLAKTEKQREQVYTIYKDLRL